MDLNSSVSKTKSTPSKSNVNTAGSKSVGSISNNASRSNKIPFYEGQVIKGEITDLHNDKVTVTLENNTKVTGTIQNATELSIGQTAAFKILEITPKGVALEAIAKSFQSSELVIINKALEEASLVNNERNQSIVRELLFNQLSINKQSILTVIQQSLTFKNTSISTLVLMNKHNIPMTEQTTTQFENYRNYEHRILNEVETISNAIPDLLSKLASDGDSKDIQTFGNQLLSLTLDQPTSIHNRSTSFSSTESPQYIILSPESRLELLEILEDFPLSEELKNNIQKGTASVRDVACALQNNMVLAQEMDQIHLEDALNVKISENKGIPFTPEEIAVLTEELKGEVPLTFDIFNSASVREVLEKYADIQRENGELVSLLSFEDRTNLLKNLESFPLAPTFKEKIISGEATLVSLLTAVKNALMMTNQEAVKDLLSSKEFKELFKEGLLSNWTLTPKSLVKENEVDHLYTKLYEQLSKLSELVHNQMNSQQTEHLLQQSNQLKDNLDFMKTLNTMFNYVQLPMRLKEQNIHSDLYVYTNKKALKNNKNHIHVLLHLDMESLGPLDIKIVLDNNQINSTFYISDEFSKALISNNIDQLEEALNEKGFLLNVDVKKLEKEVDIVQDFIEKDMPTTSLKRYAFDIRA